MKRKIRFVSNGKIDDSYLNNTYFRGAPRPNDIELLKQGIVGYYEWVNEDAKKRDTPIITSMQTQNFFESELFEI